LGFFDEEKAFLQHLFEIEIFCNVFTVTFHQFKASISFKMSILTPNFLTVWKQMYTRFIQKMCANYIVSSQISSAVMLLTAAKTQK